MRRDQEMQRRRRRNSNSESNTSSAPTSRKIAMVLPAVVMLLNSIFFLNYLSSNVILDNNAFENVEKMENLHIVTTQDDQDATPLRPYPRYLMIIKSSRVGSTFVHQTIKKHYNTSILPQWEGDGKAARAHFERCGKLPPNRTGIVDGKWVCTAYLNDRFRNKQTFQELIDLIRDFNASVVIQMRANVIEKGISMSKRWGVMKRLENPESKQPTEIEIANDVFEYTKGTLEFTRSIVHAAYHNFIPLPSPTQEKPLWIWYEDLARSCETKFTELFHEIGMSHLPLPTQSCKELKFPRDKDDPYNPIMVETLSREPLLRPMIDHSKFNLEVDTDSYRKQFEKETEMEGVIYGTW